MDCTFYIDTSNQNYIVDCTKNVSCKNADQNIWITACHSTRWRTMDTGWRYSLAWPRQSNLEFTWMQIWLFITNVSINILGLKVHLRFFFFQPSYQFMLFSCTILFQFQIADESWFVRSLNLGMTLWIMLLDLPYPQV